MREAQSFEEQDKKNYERIEAKNALENYAFSMRNMVSSGGGCSCMPLLTSTFLRQVREQKALSESDRATAEGAIKEATEWLERNLTADKAEFVSGIGLLWLLDADHDLC